MSEDYYQILNVSKTASEDEIQKSYRKLARKYHPDLQDSDQDKEKAKQSFQKVQQAYDILSDPEKRKKYDQFGADFDRYGDAQQYGRSPFGSGQMPGGMEIDFSDILNQMGGGGGGRSRQSFEDFLSGFGQSGFRSNPRGDTADPAAPSLDLMEQITIPFNTAILGGQYQFNLQTTDGRDETINLKIPKGIESGKKIRLKGKGRRGPGNKMGDLLISVNVAPHPVYKRTGNHLLVNVPITVFEALLGTKIDLPTPGGTVTLTVPPNTNSGKTLRLRGLGVATEKSTGDLLAEIQIVMPPELSSQQRETLQQLAAETKIANPRRGLIW